MWQATEAPPARKYRQKLGRKDPHHLDLLETHSDKILENPYLGDVKRGDLRGVFEYTYHYAGATHSIAYTLDTEMQTVEFLRYGPHENFYRDLKHYRKGAR